MQASGWVTGTYEVVIDTETDAEDRDIIITVFPRSVTWPKQDWDRTPVLATVRVFHEELGDATRTPETGSRSVGMTGLEPEAIEAEYGPQMGVRVLLALFRACEADFNGTTEDGTVWREPNADAFGILERTHDVMAILKEKLFPK